MKSKLCAAFAAASVVLSVATAQADTQFFIGLQQNGGPITMYPETLPSGTFATHTRIFGLNNPADISPTSTLPLLQGDIIAVSSNGEPGKLVVWMTGSDNLGANLPLGTQAFESSFTQNLLPAGWTVQVDTFFDPADGVFTTAVPLSSHLFTGSNLTFDEVVPLRPGSGSYSVTERFTISANGLIGSTNTTGVIAFVSPARPALRARRWFCL